MRPLKIIAAAVCGKPVLIQSKGPHARKRKHSDESHDMCTACWLDARDEGLAKARKMGMMTR